MHTVHSHGELEGDHGYEKNRETIEDTDRGRSSTTTPGQHTADLWQRRHRKQKKSAHTHNTETQPDAQRHNKTDRNGEHGEREGRKGGPRQDENTWETWWAECDPQGPELRFFFFTFFSFSFPLLGCSKYEFSLALIAARFLVTFLLNIPFLVPSRGYPSSPLRGLLHFFCFVFFFLFCFWFVFHRFFEIVLLFFGLFCIFWFLFKAWHAPTNQSFRVCKVTLATLQVATKTSEKTDVNAGIVENCMVFLSQKNRTHLPSPPKISRVFGLIYRVCRFYCNFCQWNPQRFQWFFRNGSFSRKIKNPFGGLSVFQRKSGNFHWTWNKNTHFTNESQRKQSQRSAPPSIIILLE